MASNQAESNAMSLKNQRIERVIQVIALIPIGKVATYGQVAEAAQLKDSQDGWAESLVNFQRARLYHGTA